MAVKAYARHRIIEKTPKLFLLIGCLASDQRRYHDPIEFLRPTTVRGWAKYIALRQPDHHFDTSDQSSLSDEDIRGLRRSARYSES